MRPEEFWSRTFLESILAQITNDTGDLQCHRTWFSPASTLQFELPADRILVRPVTFRHRVVDQRDFPRITLVELVEEPATQKSRTDCRKVSGGSSCVLGDRFLPWCTRRLTVDSYGN